ncbi:thioesterase-like superfamily-domain-containing protein [Auriculariales sp. MPI-PUGE-AT-0066]|nr:thioesterase-like superfamily-domain-containing protein [Auriculariales sp. MPI-PUGE-AT-0066]
MVISFVESSAVELVKTEGDVLYYRGSFHPDLAVGPLPFGGVIISTVLSAVAAAVQDKQVKDVIHLTVNFLRACVTAPCDICVTFVRSSKSFINLDVTIIQQNRQRIAAHALVGTLSDAPLDTTTAPPLSLAPGHPLSRKIPITVHPSQAQPVPLPPHWGMARSVCVAPDLLYDSRNKLKLRTRNDGSDPNMNGIIEYGGFLQFLHPMDTLQQCTLPVVADMLPAVPRLLPPEEAKKLGDTGYSWHPTMTFSIDFKHRIPRGSSYSTNTATIYSQCRFMTDGRGEYNVEIWTAPAGTLGDESACVEPQWREKMVCLATATQMALSMTGEASLRVGEKANVAREAKL